MNKAIYILFGALIFSSFLSTNVHRTFTLIPELISGVVLLFILLRVANKNPLYIKPKYVILGILATLHILASLIINYVPPGTVVTGIRPYLKWVPIFFLPAIYHFSAEQMQRQLKFLLFLTLLQFPLVLYQRFIQFRGVGTGDLITGTLGSGASGALSIYLISAIALLLSFYFWRYLKLGHTLICIAIIFIPTTLNETKITFVLLPIVIIISLIYSNKYRITNSQVIGVAGLGVLLVVGYVTVYDYLVTSWGKTGIIEFVTDVEKTKRYLGIDDRDRDIEKLNINNKESNLLLYSQPEILEPDAIGRLGFITLSFRSLSDKPVNLWLGLGIGNVSHSIIKSFSGEYSHLGRISGTTLISYLLLELGVGSIVMFLIFMYFIFQDCRSTNKEKNAENIATTLASGWITIIFIFLLASLYLNLFFFNALIYLFAYFSGYIASESYKKALSVRSFQ